MLNRLLVSITMLFFLSACGGGGGGSDDNSSTVTPPDTKPPVTTEDTTPPTITLLGSIFMHVEFGEDYNELGATALDDIDGEIDVTISGSVDTQTLGFYDISYYAEDSSGNSTSVIRTVKIIDSIAPVLTLNGDNPLYVAYGHDFNDPGATAIDNVDGLVNVVVDGAIDTSQIGSFTISYRTVDLSGNKSEISRDVIVQDTDAPVITINGDASVTIYKGNTYVDQGATAEDNVDGDLTSKVETSDLVNTAVPGTYFVEYYVYDEAGNRAEISREVIVAEKSYAITFRDNDLTLYENEYTHKFWFDFDEEQNTSRQLMFRVSDQSTAEKRYDFELNNTWSSANEQSGYIELSVYDDNQFEGQELIHIEVLNEDYELVTQLDITLDDSTTQPVQHNSLAASFSWPSTAVFDDTLYVTDGRHVVKYDLAQELNVAYGYNPTAPLVNFGDGIGHNGEMYYFADGLLFRLDQGSLSFDAISSAPAFVEWISELQIVNNKLYVIGGQSQNNETVDTNYSYNLETKQWQTQAPSNVVRYGAATAVVDDSIHVFGGNFSGYEYSGYSTVNDSWLTRGTNRDLGNDKNTAVTSGKYVYISKSELYRNQLVMRYDTAMDVWESRTFAVLSQSHRDSFMYKGRIYLVGDSVNDDDDKGDLISLYWGDN